MPAHLRNSDLTLNAFRHCWKPLCSRLLRFSCRTRLCDSLLTVRSEMTVYHYYCCCCYAAFKWLLNTLDVLNTHIIVVLRTCVHLLLWDVSAWVFFLLHTGTFVGNTSHVGFVDQQMMMITMMMIFRFIKCERFDRMRSSATRFRNGSATTQLDGGRWRHCSSCSSSAPRGGRSRTKIRRESDARESNGRHIAAACICAAAAACSCTTLPAAAVRHPATPLSLLRLLLMLLVPNSSLSPWRHSYAHCNWRNDGASRDLWRHHRWIYYIGTICRRLLANHATSEDVNCQ